jgi:methylase of polypeptide subunit release factors
MSRRTLPRLSPEITFEPSSALDGGPDGLDVVRRLIDRLPSVTEVGGRVLEIGAGQDDATVQAVAERPERCTVTPDLAGRPRLVRIDLSPA